MFLFGQRWFSKIETLGAVPFWNVHWFDDNKWCALSPLV